MKKNLLAIIFICFTGIVSGQFSNTLYFMDWVPQSNYLNPAKQYPCNVYFGIPGINSLQFYAGNNVLSLNDAVYPGDTSLFFFNSTKESLENIFENEFKKVNYFNAYQQIRLLSFGFRPADAPDFYISFDWSLRSEFNVTASKDFMSFIIKQDFGPEGVTHDYGKTGMNFLMFTEFGIGISKESNLWNIGFRPKILFGKANAMLNMKKFTKYSAMSNWDIDADIDFRLALPKEFYIDSARMSFDPDSEGHEIVSSEFSPDNLVDIFMSTDNFGFGLDFGFEYKPSSEFELSGSVIDLGFIRWNSSTYSADANTTQTLEGPEASDISTVVNDGSSIYNAFFDTLVNNLEFEENYDPYFSFLSGKIFLGTRYFVHPKIAFGGLSISQIYQGVLRQQATFSANFYPGKVLSASFSYSIRNNTYDNFGFGFHFKPGPFNLYMVFEKIPFVYAQNYVPLYMQYFNFRFGLNLVVGCGKKIKDFPMID
ncbi:MAG: DUF5723 family protein [bacterium]